MKEVFYVGNKDFLELPKTAFFSSRNINPLSLIRCYDWATEQRKAGRCIISGFHSMVEKDVLHFLMKGKQPVILVLGRSLYKHIPEEFASAIETGRLLIVSPLSQQLPRQSIESCEVRNKYIIELADEIVFSSLNENSNLYKLYLAIKDTKKVTLI